MISSDILQEIKKQISKEKLPQAVKMSEATWQELCKSNLAFYFGDVDRERCKVYGLMVLIDNALPLGVTRVYTEWVTQELFPFA